MRPHFFRDRLANDSPGSRCRKPRFCPSEERHILANNLRNIAQRITQMAEKRSKPSLIRSDDSIDRQLTQGEASPHGSIDMMKWIAGYLDGAHPHTND